MHKCIPSSMNKYNCTAVRYHLDTQQLLHIAQHETSRKPFVAPSRSQYAAYGGRCHLLRLSSILRATHAQ